MQSSLIKWLALTLVVLVTIGELRPAQSAPAEGVEKTVRKAKEPKIRRTIRVVEEPPTPPVSPEPEVAPPSTTSAPAPPQNLELNNSGSSNTIDVNPSISIAPASPPTPPPTQPPTQEPEQDDRLAIVPVVSAPAPTQAPVKQELQSTTGSENQVIAVADESNNKLAQLLGNSNNELISLGANNGNVARQVLTNSGNVEEVHLNGVGNRKVTHVSNAVNQEEEQLVQVGNTKQQRPVAQVVAQADKRPVLDLPSVQINLNNYERLPMQQIWPGFGYAGLPAPVPGPAPGPAPLESSTGLGVSLPAELSKLPLGRQVLNIGNPQVMMQPLPVPFMGQPFAMSGYPAMAPIAVQPSEPMMLVSPSEWHRLQRAQRKCRRHHHHHHEDDKRRARHHERKPRPQVIEIHHKQIPEVTSTTTTTTTPAPETTTTTTTTPAPETTTTTTTKAPEVDEDEEEEVVEWETVRVPKTRKVKKVKL